MTEQTPDTERKNPLLERVSIPGEKFKVPSGGLFYKNDELSEFVKNGEIMINPMNAMDELLLKSPDKLLSGEAITDVLGRCIPDVQKPGDLLAKDVDFLLMCLRLISYGPEILLLSTHTCEEAKEHTYSVPIRPLIQKARALDPTAIKKYKLEIKGGQVVELHPPKFAATVKLYEVFGLNSNDEDVDPIKIGEQLVESISEMISNVDGHEDQDHIKEWLKTIRVGDVQAISEKVAELSDWGVDPIVEVECRDCKEKMDLMVPINPISFFT